MSDPGSSSVAGHDPAAGWRDPPGLGKLLLTCSAIGVASSLILITVSMIAAGQVWQSSLALGAFVAIWGGLGFGSMIGGVLYLSRIEHAAHAARQDDRSGSRPA